MNRVGTKFKKAGSLFLVLALALTFLPASALAVNEESAGIAIVATHQTVDTNGKYLDFSDVQTIDPLHFTIVGDTSEESINLWPTSSNMISAGEDDGSTVPYIVDEEGNTWYLNGIQWANNIPGLNPSATATGEILSSSEIYNAALDSSMEAYNFDPSEISGEPETIYAKILLNVDSAYYICYNWTATPPEAWGFGELPQKYTVEYDINLPAVVKQLYRIMYDEEQKEDYLEIGDQGALNNVQTEVNGLTRDVYEGRNFYVAAGLDSRYRGFLAFSDPSGEDVSYYYLSFDDEEPDKTKYPWMTEDDTITYYKSGQTVQAASDLADENKTINITANWVEIDPLTDEELAAADDALTLDVFERGGYYDGGSAVADNVVENDLLLQWTSVDENLDGYGIKTGNDVMLDEESTISYLLTTRLNSRLTSLRDDTNYGKFARFTFTLNIDNQLKFANVENDQVSIVFSSAFLKPDDTEPTNISGAMVTPEGNDSYKITFNPDNVPTSTDGKTMQIEINVEWCLDKYSYAETTKPIQISGLDFKLKEPVADKENFTLNSSANITGSMDMKTRSNIRFYYTAAYGLLNGSSDWQTYFGGNGADPVALVHALQFMDYKLADYDMSKEEDPDGPTNALTSGSCTAKATYTQYTITATAGANGSIIPNGATKVYKGDSQTFTITAGSGYRISDVLVDNVSVGAVSSYTFEDVAADHTISVTFEKNSGGSVTPTPTRYTITAEAGEGGSISPDGRVRVDRGDDQTFRITPDDGYEIADVLVDGESVGAVSSYTFENVRANHTIEVVFEAVEEVPGVADPDDTGVSDWLNTEDHNAYLSGYPGSLFGPDNNMTRAEVAQMFYNLLLDKDVAITVTFDDVPADAWYAEAVNTLASLGMISGVGDNLFQPERSITRAEFTTIAMRFTDGVLDGENIFPDVNPDDWFYDYVVGSIQYGWINGYPDGTFGPNDPISRAEVTTITNRMLGRSADEAFVDSNQASLVQFGDITDRHWAYYQVMEATNAHDYTETNGVEDWTSLN